MYDRRREKESVESQTSDAVREIMSGTSYSFDFRSFSMIIIMGCFFSKTPPVIEPPPITTISALFDSSKDAQERMMELRMAERMMTSRGSIISEAEFFPSEV